MTTGGKAATLGAVIVVLAGARAYVVRRGVPLASAAPLEAGATLPHMDHAPRHGGLVLMNGDTHFEVVIDAAGDCRVYFTDAVRAELPASYASEVTVGVSAPNTPRQTVTFTRDDRSKTWQGRIPLDADPQAIVRVMYAGPDGPYWIDVPLAAWPRLKPA